MNEYFFLDKASDAQLIIFCKNNITRKARKLLGLNLGFLKRGPYKVRKINYPILVKFYLDWMELGRQDGRLDIRKV